MCILHCPLQRSYLKLILLYVPTKQPSGPLALCSRTGPIFAIEQLDNFMLFGSLPDVARAYMM